MIGSISKVCRDRKLPWSWSFVVGATGGAAFAVLIFVLGYISQNQLVSVDGNATWTVVVFLGIVVLAGLRCADFAAGGFFE